MAELGEVALTAKDLSFKKPKPEIQKSATKEPDRLPVDLKDESKPKESLIKPLVPKDTSGYSQLEKIYKYYSTTKDLEVDSPRTRLLEEVTDKLTKDLVIRGTEIPVLTRVIILNRGQDANAFACADGTIFVTQALLNKVDTEDEVAAILAHEVNHLVNRSHTNGLTPSTGWIHEFASDEMAPQLLEKAGFNSASFSSAILKISNGGRDYEHQTSIARASENIGLHSFIHYQTSNVEPTPLPKEFKKVPEQTNLEILKNFIYEGDLDNISKNLKNLHPQDLFQAYEYAIATNSRAYQEPKAPIANESYQILNLFQDFFRERLVKAGFPEDEIDLFYLASQEPSNFRKFNDFSRFESPDRIINLPYLLDNKLVAKMFNTVFEGEHSDHLYLRELADFVELNMCLDRNIKPHEILVNETSILDFMKGLKEESEKRGWGEFLNKDKDPLSALTFAYIGEAFKDPSDPERETKIKDFLIKVKDLGIEIKRSDYEQRYNLFKREDPVADLIDEVFGVPEKREKTFYEKIDEAIVPDPEKPERKSINFSHLSMVVGDGLGGEITEADIPKIIEYIEKNTEIFEPPAKQKPEAYGLTENDIPLMKLIYAYGVRSELINSVFPHDSEDFYKAHLSAMENSNIKTDQLSLKTLRNVNRYLIRDTTGFCKIEDPDRYISLPYIAALESKISKIHFSNLTDLDNYRYQSGLYSYGNLFQHGVEGLLINRFFRSNFLEIIKTKGIQEEELYQAQKMVEELMPDGTETNRFVRELRLRYLRSENILLEDKMNAAAEWRGSLGFEGFIIAADYITTLDEYRHYRERYQDLLESVLKGEDASAKKLASADILTSFYTKNFELLLKTTSKEKQDAIDSSTEAADLWLERIFVDQNSSYSWGKEKRYVLDSMSGKVSYIPETGKIGVDQKSQQNFQGFSETLGSARELPNFVKAEIAFKALTDQGGALTSPENRKILADFLARSLDIDSSFVRTAVSIAAETAPAEYFSFSAASLLAPLLFRNLDLQNVDFLKLQFQDGGRFKRWTKNSMEEDLREITRLLSTSTEALVENGIVTEFKSGSKLDLLAIQADKELEEVREILRTSLIPGERKESEVEPLDPGTEAIIKAVESSGALGVRSLQLSRQLYHFSPEVDRRLADSFDARKGLSKLLFWENLEKIVRDGKNPELTDLIENRMISLDKFLGGGSLNTTFAATIKNPDGTTRKTVVKMLNPNPTLFITATHKTATSVLEEIESSGSKEDVRLARMGKVFVDLSREWCIKDIQDATFERDDDVFRQTIASFNQALGNEVFYAPERVITTYQIKSEDEATGPTVNKFLNDNTVSDEQKTETVNLIKNFYVHQLSVPTGTDEHGNPYYLVHSDPHVGNFTIEYQDAKPKIGVIDRSMYLKLTKTEALMYKNLLTSGDAKDFLYGFVEAALDRNNIQNQPERKSKRNKITHAMVINYLKLRGKNLTKGIDNFELLRELFEETTAAGLPIPLELRLMIRNVEAFKELQKRYS